MHACLRLSNDTSILLRKPALLFNIQNNVTVFPTSFERMLTHELVMQNTKLSNLQPSNCSYKNKQFYTAVNRIQPDIVPSLFFLYYLFECRFKLRPGMNTTCFIGGVRPGKFASWSIYKEKVIQIQTFNT